MLDASALDAGLETRADFLGKLRRDLLAEKARHVLVEEGLPARLVVPGSVAVARLHRRDDMHQSRTIAAPLEHFGHDLFLADVRLGNVLNRNPRRRRQLLSATSDRIAQRLGKARVVEYPNPSRLQKCRHYPPRSRPAAACPSPKSGHSRRELRASVPDSDRSDPAPSSTPLVTRPSELYSILFGSGFAGLGFCPACMTTCALHLDDPESRPRRPSRTSTPITAASRRGPRRFRPISAGCKTIANGLV